MSILYDSALPAPDVERYRGRLFGIAYRMLGDVHDAEDLVQEAYLRWHCADQASVDAPEGWLVSVITRLSIDRLRHAAVERRAYVGPWLPEPLPTRAASASLDMLFAALASDEMGAEPPDHAVEIASDLSVALLVLLERLAPEERAAFLLRDVFDAGYGEIARTLQKTEAAARQLVHRARTRVRAERPRFEVPGEVQARLLDAFLAALAADDPDALLAVFDPAATLTADGGGKVPAARRVVEGRDRVVPFLLSVERKAAGRLVHRRAHLNGGPALVSAACLPGAPAVPRCATTFAFVQTDDGACIRAVYRVLNPDKLQHLTNA